MLNMKRFILLALCLIVALTLFACAQSEPAPEISDEIAQTEPAILPGDYTYSENARIGGFDLSGLTVEQARTLINEKLDDYTLTAVINGKNIFLSADELDLQCDTNALIEYGAALNEGRSTTGIRAIRYNEDLLRSRIFNTVNIPAENASLAFNKETNLFELVDSKDGYLVDLDEAFRRVDGAIQKLDARFSTQLPMESYSPEISQYDSKAKQALNKANDYVTTEISYNFTMDDEVYLATLTPDRIADMIGFKSDLTPYLKDEAIREYVEELNTQYGMTGVDGSFIATNGSRTDLTVTYYAPYVDVDAMCEDVKYYLEKGISGTRLPPQLDNLVPQEMPFKGNYIEVDLTNQMLYLYKDAECIMETSIVTGNVYRYMRTPTGVYKVLTRRMHVILKGEDYETYVKYWMQFRGGYGLHDAYWRSTFGGNEYLYNGSHGCVNIPSKNAQFLYENIYVGYPVVLHGGASNEGPLQQTILGKDEYNLSIHAKPFQLNTRTSAGNGKLTYTSSNPAVASVTEDGVVTIHRTGKARINVSFEESRYYTAASLNIQINVDDPCGDNHTYGEWEITTEPTCVTGIQTRKCTKCDMEQTKPAAAVSAHTYGDWELKQKPTCQDGYQSKTCAVCGHTLNRTLTAEHDLRDWKVRENPTCETPGEHYRSCRDCDYELIEELPPLGHCFTTGEEFCENCDMVNPNWVPPTEAEDEED